jgi:hypothetical protein
MAAAPPGQASRDKSLPRAMPMMFHPFRRGPQTASIAALYGTIVARARGADRRVAAGVNRHFGKGGSDASK